jgi:hypothetical protein
MNPRRTLFFFPTAHGKIPEILHQHRGGRSGSQIFRRSDWQQINGLSLWVAVVVEKEWSANKKKKRNVSFVSVQVHFLSATGVPLDEGLRKHTVLGQEIVLVGGHGNGIECFSIDLVIVPQFRDKSLRI